MTWPFAFSSYEESLIERPDCGNHIMASYEEKTVVLYTLCRANVAHFAQSYQPGFLKSNHFKIGKSWELRTSFSSAVIASRWGKKGENEAILAVSICRFGFEELLKAALLQRPTPQRQQQNTPSEAGFSWEKGKDLFGTFVGPNHFVLRIRGELLNHMCKYWVQKAVHMTVFVKAAKEFIREKHPELIMVPYERPYNLEPGYRRGLGLQPLGFEDSDMDHLLASRQKKEYVAYTYADNEVRADEPFDFDDDEFDDEESIKELIEASAQLQNTNK